jgi:hypothetical protein
VQDGLSYPTVVLVGELQRALNGLRPRVRKIGDVEVARKEPGDIGAEGANIGRQEALVDLHPPLFLETLASGNNPRMVVAVVEDAQTPRRVEDTAAGRQFYTASLGSYRDILPEPEGAQERGLGPVHVLGVEVPNLERRQIVGVVDRQKFVACQVFVAGRGLPHLDQLTDPFTRRSEFLYKIGVFVQGWIAQSCPA